MVGAVQRWSLEEILTEKQIHHVVNKAVGDDIPWTLKSSALRPAADGLAGFLGDHMKADIFVDVEGEEKIVHLFIKRVPVGNEAKAAFITENNFYEKEGLMYKLLEEICDDGPNPWCVKAYIYTNKLFVMPDLSVEGYTIRHYLDTFDLDHVLLTTASIARFHAAFMNYETNKSIELDRTYNIFEEYAHILTEPFFSDTQWLRVAPKSTVKLLQKFSKIYGNLPDLESKLTELFIEACNTMQEYKETVNVLIHRDLWVNNIMFKYENDAPVNAVLLDYQCVRYAPPAIDLLVFLILTTDRSFREQYEKTIFDHYYSTFVKSLNKDSKKKLDALGYDKENFLEWCERARMFAMVQGVVYYPMALMDPKTAEKTFNDPETSEKHILEDRSEPVVAHASLCEAYKNRNLEIAEEFVEKYVLK